MAAHKIAPEKGRIILTQAKKTNARTAIIVMGSR
jgi:hypothetical protein